MVLIPKAAMPSAIEFTLLDLQGKDAGPVESVRVLAYGPEVRTLESVSHLSGVPVKAAWAMEGSRALVQVTPLDNASKLRAAVPVECVVVPDRFGNDIVVDPRSLGQGRSLLPWAPLVTGFLGSGSEVLVLICPGQAQTAEFRKGEGLSFAVADVAFQQAPLCAGVITCERAWHLERFAAEAARIRSGSSAHAVRGQLATCGARRPAAVFALFSDKESALFDKQDVLFRKSNDFAGAAEIGVIYLYGRTMDTPPGVLTPVDLIRDALGLKAAQQAPGRRGAHRLPQGCQADHLGRVFRDNRVSALPVRAAA